MLGIENLKKVVSGGVDVVNGVNQVADVDYKQVIKELMDLSEDELLELHEEIKDLDLTDDALEKKIEDAVGDNGKYLLMVLRLIKLFVPSVGA